MYRIKKESVIFRTTQKEVADVVGCEVYTVTYHFTRKKKNRVVINGCLIEKL